jgi:hypothetical protein
MKISSSVFENNKRIPSKYTCDGDDLSPALAIEDVPTEAKSLALIMEDPDSPGKTWIHWVVWNINPEISQIKESNLPPGALQGETSDGDAKYHGPCPSQGEHRYFFKLFALDKKIDLTAGAKKEELEKEMEGHIIASAEIMGRYSRQ